MAVITGALVTGDSVKSGLMKLVETRLGNVDLSVSAGDRFLTDSLARKISVELGIPSAGVLQLKGSVSAGGGTTRVPKVKIFGVEAAFSRVLGPGTFDLPMNENEAVISDNLAARLGVTTGDEILIRINKPGPVPIDAPFVSDAENIVSARFTVLAIAGKEQHGRFLLQNTQVAPFNVFISKEYLQKLSGLPGLTNLILLSGDGKISSVQVEKSMFNNRSIRDAGLHLDKHATTGEWILRTPRVFFDLPTLAAIESVPADKTFWFSYFVNEFRIGSRTTPYSFVSTLPGNQIAPGEILVNRWLADDLSAKPGDSVELSYFMVGPLRNLSVEKAQFRITGIISMDDPRCDRVLMPEIPGLSDAGNCRDWETSIPIDLEKIRNKDEKYWKQYQGTPKAFINPMQAAGMWQNRFGKFTQVRFPAATNQLAIEHGILDHLRPSDTGVMVSMPANEGISAASSGVDFSGLFLGLSFFLIAGGIILTILIIRLGLESRIAQIGTLRAVGWPEKRIRQAFILENGLLALIGTAIGLALTYLYTILVFKALNGVWNSIVLTDSLKPIFKPETLVAGMFISLIVSIVSAWLALRGYFSRKPVDLLGRNRRVKSDNKKRILTYLSAAISFGSLAMVAYGLIRFQSVSPTFFFFAGTLMLVSIILNTIRLNNFHQPREGINLTFIRLGISNIIRNGNRSLSVILLFAIGIFMVLAIGANRKNTGIPGLPLHTTGPRTTGTGGFSFYIETTVPVPDNLSNALVRAKYGMETASEIVQLKRMEGDDASCLNLNRVSNPPVIGVPEGAFDQRFHFVSQKKQPVPEQAWILLNQELSANTIPAIADQTVIQWGLGLKIGDTLKYKSEAGNTVHLVLVGGLENSIFQGSILVSEKQFIRHWPSQSGTNILLVSAKPENIPSVQSELLRVFRDYGIDLKPADEKLAEFNSIENTYLSIFLVMGALAMLLGTIGLAIILARNLQEQRSGIALLRAVGFSSYRILRLVFFEYSALLLAGTLAGGIPALVSVLPGLLNKTSEVSPLFLISILFLLIASGMIWILVLGWISVKKLAIAANLRAE